VLSRAREQGRRAVCAANQRQVAIGMTSRADDHNGDLPDHPVATANNFTTRSGWHWSESRPAFNQYVGGGALMYCPSATGETVPTAGNWRTFVNGQNAGWDAIPVGQPANYYVRSSFSFFPNTYRVDDGEPMRMLLGAEEPIADVGNEGLDEPVFPSQLEGIPGGAEPMDIPFSADYAFTRYPMSLEAITDGPFVHADQYDSSSMDGTHTRVYAHLGPTNGFGLNASFMDGSVRWRMPGEAGPRANLHNSFVPGSYKYVFWF